MNSVYYIKQQAKQGSTLYYLMSTKPSSTKGTIGWVKSTDVKSYTHKSVDKKAKTFYLKGKGVAYNRAWGGTENRVHSSLKSMKGEKFSVQMTETVGNNTWYRGTLKGKTVWIHSDHLEQRIITNTSRVGQLKNSKVNIYKTLDPNSKTVSTKPYMNSVYYIKQQAKQGSTLYYLMSTKPSSSKGTIGWVKSTDVKSYTHKSVDKKAKTFYLKGKGVAYNRAWGGTENRVHSSLKSLKGEQFNVHMTESVGNNTWYRGTLKGKTVWIHSSHLKQRTISKTSRLGQLKNSKVNISKTLDSNAKTVSTKPYMNSVYYIKQQAKQGSTLYYLMSTKPSSASGTIGWVKSTDVTTYTHKSVDKKAKTFILKGKGVAYNRAWG